MTPPTFTRLLAPLASLALLGPTQAQIVLTVPNVTLQPNTSGQVVLINFQLTDTNPLTVYSGGFSVQIGDGSGNSGTAPVITGASIFNVPAGSPFTASNTGLTMDQSSGDWIYDVQFLADPNRQGSGVTPVSVPGSASFGFIAVTLSTGATLGSWSLSISGNSAASSPDPYFGISTFSDTASVDSVNGTLSAVPEPEETMAVMAGVSLGLGWWIRRRRSKTPQPKA